MIIRPADEQGDVLPVLSRADMLRGAEAVALLVRERLELLSGEWWENPAWGNAILETLKENRCTEADQQALAAYITSYIRQTPDVRDVRDVAFSVEGRRFRFTCTVGTADGDAEIRYNM